jgi:hypothetical protein
MERAQMTWLDSETIRKLLLILSLRTGNQQLGFPTHIHKKEVERFGNQSFEIRLPESAVAHIVMLHSFAMIFLAHSITICDLYTVIWVALQ